MTEKNIISEEEVVTYRNINLELVEQVKSKENER